MMRSRVDHSLDNSVQDLNYVSEDKASMLVRAWLRWKLALLVWKSVQCCVFVFSCLC